MQQNFQDLYGFCDCHCLQFSSAYVDIQTTKLLFHFRTVCSKAANNDGQDTNFLKVPQHFNFFGQGKILRYLFARYFSSTPESQGVLKSMIKADLLFLFNIKMSGLFAVTDLFVKIAEF